MRNQITRSPNLYLTAAVAAGIALMACQGSSIRILRHRVQALETLIRLDLLTAGKASENQGLVVALEASMAGESPYGDVNALASAAGLSLASYEDGQSVEANQAVLRAQEVALQATATYPNLLAFLANLRAAHPNIALVSVTGDRKAGEPVRGPVGATASPELLASIRLRVFWTAGAVDTKRSP